ncbi:MAG TPA: transposase, partial [Desulfosporosinus sp.]|nr:transposase [Desulfosporosinus sp.]
MKRTRMSVFQEISETERIPLMTVRRIFARFWQRGMTRNALLPDYSKSGGKGKEKNVKEKMGRRRVYSEDDSEGIVVTDSVKKHFEIATNKYWRTGQKKSLRQVYRLMLADFYSITVRKNEEIEKIIRGSDSIPTFQQYY